MEQSLNIISIIIAGVILVKMLTKRNRQRRRPAYHVQHYLRQRNMKGRYSVNFEDMMISPHLFTENFQIFVPETDTRPYDTIPPKLKLAIVFEFMASGDLQRHIASTYRVSKQYLGTIIDQVCNALIEVLQCTVPQSSKEGIFQIV